MRLIKTNNLQAVLRRVVQVGFMVVGFVVILSACDKQTGLAHLSDRELRQRHYQCQMSTRLSAVQIQICKNLLRECQQRKQQGNYAC